MKQESQGRYRVERISNEGELRNLREAWSALLATVPQASIFLTWEWISTWWRNREESWELWLLVAWDPDGRLAGVAPWMLVEEPFGPWSLRRLMFARNSGMFPNHMDILARPAEQGEICAAFMDYLQRQGAAWDVLDLEALAADSVVGSCLATAGGHYREREPLVCPFAGLPQTWEDYERERLSANRRQQLRSRRRKLERDYPGQVTYHEVTHPDELPLALDTLIAFNLVRWHDKGLHASFDDDCFVAFHREMAPLALARGWLRLYMLKVAGQVIAVEYCFRYGDVFTNYQRGFDQAWERYSPGQLLYAHTIRQAIAEHAREFDMLRGAHDYKLSWADAQRFDRHPLLSRTWQGHAWIAGGILFDAAQRTGRKMVSPEIREKINLFLASRGR